MRKIFGSLALLLTVSVAPVRAQDVELVDAVKNGTVTAEGLGKGDTAVMTLRVKAASPVNLLIPAGTFFTTECFRANKNNRDQQETCAQPLIIIEKKRVPIPGGGTIDIDLTTACADQDLLVPKETDRFQLDQASEVLRMLAQCLDEKNLAEFLRQIAVWVVTNDFSSEFLDSQSIATLKAFFQSCGLSVNRTIFNQTPSEEFTLFVPIVLSSSGLNNAFFTSELTLVNRSSQVASVSFRYAAAFGDGSGTASTILPPGQQIFPDAIAYLRTVGVPLPASGNRGGTLAITFSGITVGQGAASVRTTTAVAGGRAGLAYAGVPSLFTLTSTSYVCGLRQNATDRSNVAIQNAGSPTQGDVVLRLTLFSGDASNPVSQTLPDETLSPGGFRQISGILTSNGLSLTNGYVRIQRVGGTAPYYAYGVINDQANSDGSFIPPVLDSSLIGSLGQTLPVLVETSAFSTELVLTNWSSAEKTLRLNFIADSVSSPNNNATFLQTVKPGEQLLLPGFVNFLRSKGVTGVQSATTYAGALFATVQSGDMSGIYIGARTSALGGGGRYGLFYSAVPYGAASTVPAWLYGLQQNGETRSNLALVNTGESDSTAAVFRIEIYDGSNGLKVGEGERTLAAGWWVQIGNVLADLSPGITQGYARVTRLSGTNPFIAYAVLNDGAAPGQRTGDGAFVASQP